jgi:tRNA-2-methylthio-N6-dimethylallyladenosine synthase
MHVGKIADLLLEKPGRNTGQLVGRSPWLQPVIVDAKAGKIGDIVRARITQTGPNGLFAEPVGTGKGNQGATSFDS